MLIKIGDIVIHGGFWLFKNSKDNFESLQNVEDFSVFLMKNSLFDKDYNLLQL